MTFSGFSGARRTQGILEGNEGHDTREPYICLLSHIHASLHVLNFYGNIESARRERREKEKGREREMR